LGAPFKFPPQGYFFFFGGGGGDYTRCNTHGGSFSGVIFLKVPAARSTTTASTASSVFTAPREWAQSRAFAPAWPNTCCRWPRACMCSRLATPFGAALSVATASAGLLAFQRGWPCQRRPAACWAGHRPLLPNNLSSPARGNGPGGLPEGSIASQPSAAALYGRRCELIPPRTRKHSPARWHRFWKRHIHGDEGYIAGPEQLKVSPFHGRQAKPRGRSAARAKPLAGPHRAGHGPRSRTDR